MLNCKINICKIMIDYYTDMEQIKYLCIKYPLR